MSGSFNAVPSPVRDVWMAWFCDWLVDVPPNRLLHVCWRGWRGMALGGDVM